MTTGAPTGPAPAGPGAGLARVMRILHGAIFAGLTICALVFGAVVRLGYGPALGQVKSLGTILAGAGAVVLVLTLGVLRPRIPARPAEQSPDDFWRDTSVRGGVLLLWVAIEVSGMVGAVGYLLTGGTAPAVVAGVAILALLGVRPSRLDRCDG